MGSLEGYGRRSLFKSWERVWGEGLLLFGGLNYGGRVWLSGG